MNEVGWVTLIALTGWLILMLGAWRTHRVNARRTIVIALIWAALFVLAALVFGALGK